MSSNALGVVAKATLHNRIVGCLFGGALGDAIGLYTEFINGDSTRTAYPSRKFTFLPRSEATPFRKDSHRSPHRPGGWTDDTDHALCILLGYLHSDGKEMDPHDLAARLQIWADQGLRALDTLPIGLGKTVGSIVKNKSYLEDPEGTARFYWADSGYKVAANGSLMRTHPLGLMCLSKTLEETFEVAALYSVMTHVDPRCIISCAIGTSLVRGLTLGEVSCEEDIDQLIQHALGWWPDYRKRHSKNSDEPDLDHEEFKRHAKVNGLADLELGLGRRIGYVYKTFGSGIHLLRLAMRSKDTMREQMSLFETLITDLIMHGGDADTNACFAGSLLGSYLGFKTLPPHWRDGLTHGEWLLRKSEALCSLLGTVSGAVNEKTDTARDGGRGFLTDGEIEDRARLLQDLIDQGKTE